MKAENLQELTSEELNNKLKNIKKHKTIDAFIVGITIGIVVYAVVRNGFGFFAFFPLILAYIIIRNAKNNKILQDSIQAELDKRKL